MRKRLDKTYIHYVINTKGYSQYKLAHVLNMSHTAIARYLRGDRYLRWDTIMAIEEKTGLTFSSPEHIMFSAKNPELYEESYDGKDEKK